MKQNFLGIKWKEDESFKDIIIFLNEKHLADRLKSRYDIDFYEWAEWTLIKNQIILNFLENDYWSKCSSK